jgi:F0F1-type ATP synthase assembly protein I
MDKGNLSTSANLLRLSTVGLNFVFCTFAGLGLGLLAKKYLHLGDWVAIVGAIFGIITSYVTLYRDLKAWNKDMNDPPSAPK